MGLFATLLFPFILIPHYFLGHPKTKKNLFLLQLLQKIPPHFSSKKNLPTFSNDYFSWWVESRELPIKKMEFEQSILAQGLFHHHHHHFYLKSCGQTKPYKKFPLPKNMQVSQKLLLFSLKKRKSPSRETLSSGKACRIFGVPPEFSCCWWTKKPFFISNIHTK